MGCWPDTDQKMKITINLINDLRRFNLPIIISSHHTIPEDIQKMVDYVIYDKNNPMDNKVRLEQYYTIAEIFVVAPWEEKYHAVAGISALQNGVDFCKNKFDFIYWQDYDVSLNMDNYIKIVREYNFEGKNFLGFNWLGDKRGLATNVNAFETNAYQSIWKYPVYTCDDYLNNVTYAEKITKEGWNIIIEALGMKLLKASGLNWYLFNEEEQKNTLNNFTLCEAESKHKREKAWLCSATNNKVILFIINHSKKELPVSVKSIYSSFDYISPPSNDPVYIDSRWFLLERKGILEVTIGELSKRYDLDLPEKINEAKFYSDSITQEF